MSNSKALRKDDTPPKKSETRERSPNLTSNTSNQDRPSRQDLTKNNQREAERTKHFVASDEQGGTYTEQGT